MLPETPPPSATSEVPTNSLSVIKPSTNSSSSTDSEPLEGRPAEHPAEQSAESSAERSSEQRPTLIPLPPLRSSEHTDTSQESRGSDTPAPPSKKRRFEGFAKDGCATCKGRIWRCDGAKPICGKCKEDGRVCIWPQARSAQQPVHQPQRDKDGTIDVRGEVQFPLATNLRPSNTDCTVQVRPDLSPAFVYDARRRPSQRLVRLNHQADRVRICAESCGHNSGITLLIMIRLNPLDRMER